MTDSDSAESNRAHFLPFEEFGPDGDYWLAARDLDPQLSPFLPCQSIGNLGLPEERLSFWRNRSADRARLVEALQTSGLRHSPVQENSIRRLLLPDCLAVVTGQQPGPCGGPLYTFLKIASAVVFARRLETRWSVPVVPILWDGGDDHDVAEIDSFQWPTFEGDPVEFAFGLSGSGNQSAWSLAFPKDRFDEILSGIAEVHPPTEYFSRTVGFLRDQVQGDPSWCDVFDQFWLTVFADHPLVVVRPWERRLRELAQPLIEAEIETPEAFAQDISDVSRKLSQAGYKPRIHKTQESCSFFRCVGGERQIVRWSDATFLVGESPDPLPKERMKQELESDPTGFSPSALLRPIVQDFILPTAAAVLGPAEMAYHAQLGPLYSRHGVPRPAVLPRISATLVGTSQLTKMSQFDLSWVDLKRDEGDLAKELAASPVLTEATGYVGAMRAAAEQAGLRLTELLRAERPGQVDPVLAQLSRIEKTLDQVEDYLRREEKKRDSNTQRQIRQLLVFLRPNREMQERAYGLPPFLCRFGFDWIAEFLNDAESWDGMSHVVYPVGAKRQ